MDTLSAQACSAWLIERSLREAPYGARPADEQFTLPAPAGALASLSRQLVSALSPFDAALLRFTDWPLYHPDEMAVVQAVRAASGERGPLIASPGHRFDATEADLLAGMFCLALSYGWSAYLYFDNHAVLHGWEGDLLDVWAGFDHLEVVRARCAAHGAASTLAGNI